MEPSTGYKCVLAVLVFAVACGEDPPARPELTRPTRDPVAEEPTSAPENPRPAQAEEQPVAPVRGDHAMYFILSRDSLDDRGGLVILDGAGRFTKLADDGMHIAAGPDGVYYTSRPHRDCRIEVFSPDNTLVREIPDAPCGDVAVVPPRGVWAADVDGVGYHDGSSWTLTPPDALGARSHTFVDMAVDGSGAIWLLGMVQVFRNTGEGFRDLGAPPLPQHAYYRELVRSPDGALLVLHDHGLLRYENGAFREVDLGPGFAGQSTPVRAVTYHQDALVVAPERDGILLVYPRDAARREIDVAAIGGRRASIDLLASDGQGRLWIASDEGLMVLDRALGALLSHYPPGSIPELRGGFDEMMAVGDGPPLPPAGPIAGRAIGRVMSGGAPVAGALVEMCAAPMEITDGSACNPRSSTNLFDAVVETGADGTFEIWDVPPGDYDVAARRRNGRWQAQEAGRCCPEPGQPFDVGTIELESR